MTTAQSQHEPPAVGGVDRSHLTAVPILANPFSGAGPNMRRVARLAQALQERGLDPEPVWDISDRGELLASADLSRRVRAIVVAGGDGSVTDVINDLAGATSPGSEAKQMPGVPLAMLPMGNENLFARQYGYGDDPLRLAEAIEAGRTRGIDLGRAGQRLFTLMVSSGFDSDVVHHVDRWRRSGTELRRIRRRSYAPIITRRLLGYGFPRIAIEVDGEVHIGTHAFVFNLPQYGGGLPIGWQAKDDDGLLDWILFKKPGLISLARYGLSVITRRHLNQSDILHGRATQLRLRSPPGASVGSAASEKGARTFVQADGDPFGQTPLDLTVCPQALRVITTEKRPLSPGLCPGTH